MKNKKKMTTRDNIFLIISMLIPTIAGYGIFSLYMLSGMNETFSLFIALFVAALVTPICNPYISKTMNEVYS